MKKIIVGALILGAFSMSNAQISLGKSQMLQEKELKALTFSNADAINLSKEAMDWMDKNNAVAGPKDPYTIRLNKLFGKHKTQDGLNLNYKVYK
jgi:putative metalloprotease